MRSPTKPHILGDDGELRAEAVKRADISATLVKEVCRLYPSAWWFSREVMQPVTIGGRDLKVGTSLLICPWQLQRDPRHWERPDQFLMTRRYSSDAYVPFGAGPRACAGMAVAMLELQLLALEMAAAYRFTGVSPNPAPWPKASVTLIPPAMTIDVELRQAPPRHRGLFEDAGWSCPTFRRSASFPPRCCIRTQ